jgi:hypothetical protein
VPQSSGARAFQERKTMTALDLIIKALEASIVLWLVVGLWLFIDEVKHGRKDKNEIDNDPEEF